MCHQDGAQVTTGGIKDSSHLNSPVYQKTRNDGQSTKNKFIRKKKTREKGKKEAVHTKSNIPSQKGFQLRNGNEVIL